MAFGIIDTILESSEAVRNILRSARMAPSNTKLSKEPVKTVVNASLVAAVLLFIDRCLVYPDTIKVFSDAVLNVVIASASFVFIFIISIFILLTQPDQDADARADKWSFTIIFVWLLTLVIFLLDHLIKFFGADEVPLGFVVRRLFGGKLFGIDVGFSLQYFVYASLAFLILVLRTTLVARDNNAPKRYVVGAYAVTTLICTAMLYIAMKKI